MGELDEKKLIEKAVEYLQPVKLIDVQIASIKEEINQLRANLTSIGAIDYSKDRVTGGGTPQGLEVSVSRFMDTVAERDKRIDELSKLKCDAINRIDALDEKLGAITLQNKRRDTSKKHYWSLDKNLSYNVHKCP